MKRPAARFAEWFAAQYGLEPSRDRSFAELKKAEDNARRALLLATARVELRMEWLLRRDAALKGWCAGKEKP